LVEDLVLVVDGWGDPSPPDREELAFVVIRIANTKFLIKSGLLARSKNAPSVIAP